MAVDLAPYLCPANGKRYSLRGTFGQESCQVSRESSGYFYQLKNRNAETLWFDDLYIYRGLDTSEGNDEYYIQFSTDGKTYGAPWIKRYMNPGETFSRNPMVRHYYKSNGQLRLEGIDVSNIKFERLHPFYVFPNGEKLNEVVELKWERGETYLYAKGYGLVGFFNANNSSNFYSEWLSNAPERGKIQWFTEPVPPPIIAPVSLPAIINPRVVEVNQPNGISIRRLPTTSGNTPITILPFGTQARIGDNPSVSANGYQWIRVDSSSGNGWSAKTVSGRESFVPVSTPPPVEAFKLVYPFLSTQKWVITSRFNDPRGYGKHEGVDWGLPAPIPPMPVVCAAADGVIDRIAIAPPGGAFNGGYGKYVRIKHVHGTQTYYTWYAHCDWIPYESYVGKSVKAGEPIAVAGQTGNANGLHIHFTLQHIGHGLPGYSIADVVDPLPFFS